MANKLKQRLSYIKNINSYKRWLRNNNFYDYVGDKTVILKQWITEGPEQYPCYVMQVCTSCNYEESEPFFIYGNDLMDMALTVQRTQHNSAPS
ncbi:MULTISPECIES: hypothetical protein [Yersinia pseudotuberculosis complex]|uniref:hypothetical protein n=1 Tax=Yersinia pseudotuberculosis complex TaxID=1649845 RepID=UPI0000ED8DC6|nr:MULTISPECIES: hypothetical protein [Yersinia pseudotuberculosis complex]MCE4113193.1 hypothetical protein [Yersinia pseudotuberculosis]RYC26212.1 hypothetical protein EU971_11035 [Yersinia pseudotuberculosis]UFA64030.1 Uncharacterized protein YP598_4421 [Yersinia pseudotuberculosis]WLF06038.1 hypothetical protein Q6G25_21505 [Yersinia pseudotuberculosis]